MQRWNNPKIKPQQSDSIVQTGLQYEKPPKKCVDTLFEELGRQREEITRLEGIIYALETLLIEARRAGYDHEKRLSEIESQAFTEKQK